MRIVSVIIFVTWFTVAAAIPQRIHFVNPPSETPLAITSLTVDPAVLWPPNHKMVPVSLQVTATGDPSPECRIDSATSNEPGIVTVKTIGSSPDHLQWICAQSGPALVMDACIRSMSRVRTLRAVCHGGSVYMFLTINKWIEIHAVITEEACCPSAGLCKLPLHCLCFANIRSAAKLSGNRR